MVDEDRQRLFGDKLLAEVGHVMPEGRKDNKGWRMIFKTDTTTKREMG